MKQRRTSLRPMRMKRVLIIAGIMATIARIQVNGLQG
ncbi:hypothetical protein Psch_00163 [Pelotomaculum schinkii]|uniref:Uncharacterized protein n=1 Tax=Pelotomaculum schinkii TaxID=78350 RepID=A0A4Y7RD13_9FIRM|nr:hypothetical protein Psch_00163 [Pelotomaculum schinkii]TEB17574.1 hypothetical protein Psfp_00446 [Pelotomaculum sp. FP]